MKKFIPLLIGLALPLGGAFADDFVDKAIAFCRSKGGAYSMGAMELKGDNYCRKVQCSKTTSGRYEIPKDATENEANIEAVTEVCLPKSVIDGSFENPGNNGKGKDGKGKDGKDKDGKDKDGKDKDGKDKDGKDKDGKDKDGKDKDGKDKDGKDEDGKDDKDKRKNKKKDKTANTDDDDEDSISCVYTTHKIRKGDVCYDECKEKRTILIFGKKKKEYQRQSCIDCVVGNSIENGGNIEVDWSKIPKDSAGNVKTKTILNVPGVKVRGDLICYDKNGNRVYVAADGTICPSGSSTTNPGGSVVVIKGGRSNSSKTGEIVVTGGGSANIKLPAICESSKKKDIAACKNWIDANSRFLCSSSSDVSLCLKNYHEILAKYSTDGCVNCAEQSVVRKQSTLSGVAEVIGALAPVGVAFFQGRAQIKSAEAYSDAAKFGFEQCRLSQAKYLDWTSANELPGVTPDQYSKLGCNGYQLGAYAGLGGAFNNYYGAGYSSGLVNGYLGPYGGFNPYANGNVVGGYNPYGGSTVVGGGAVVAGFNPYISGTVVAGYNPYANGMAVAGYNPYANGAAVAGYNPYINGAAVAGYNPYVNGAAVAGYNPYVNGAAVAGYNPYVNGAAVAGYNPYANGAAVAGYNPYVNGSISAGYNPGGWGSGVGAGGGGYYGANSNYYASQQTSGIDLMLQRQGASYQMGSMSNGLNYSGAMGGGGAAAYYPMNLGASVSFGLNGYFGAY